MIFSNEHILINKKFKTQKDLFKALAKISLKKGIISNEKQLVDALIKREKEGTTGFEDGFAIPHARTKNVIKSSMFVIRNVEKFSDWPSLDGQGVKYAIALLIPENSGTYHINVLSTIATKLINQDFRNVIKKENTNVIYKSFKKLLKEIAEKTNKKVKTKLNATSHKKSLVGISACPAGIAHTFMVKEKMEQLAKQKGLNIKWETQGANGQNNKLSKDDIEQANTIIIASDIELDLSRFKGKKVYFATTNNVIKNSQKVYETSLNNSMIFEDNKNDKKSIQKISLLMLKAFKSNFGHPWIYLSITATLLAILSLVGFSVYGENWSKNPETLNLELYRMQSLVSLSLYFAMPIMAASITKKLSGKPEAFYIVLLSSIILNIPFMRGTFNSINGFNNSDILQNHIFFSYNNTFETSTMLKGSNILGCLFLTFVISGVYIGIENVKMFNKKRDKKISKILSNVFSPWLSTTIPAAISLLGIVYLLGAPLSFISSKIIYGIVIYPNDYWWIRFIIGFVFGFCIAYDLGGSINKMTLIILIGIAQYDLRFASFIPIGIPLASIGLGTTHFFTKKHFKVEDLHEVSKSFKRGLEGMTEGPLLLTNKYGWKVTITNTLSTGISTGFAYVLGIYILKGGHIGTLFMGAQAHLSNANDVGFLNYLHPLGKGALTFFASIFYGIICYYLIMIIGCFIYMGFSQIFFRIGKGKNRVYKTSEIKK